MILILCRVFDAAALAHKRRMSQINASRTKKRSHTRRISQRLRVTYKTLQENTQNPHSHPIRDKSQRDTRRDPLTDYSVWPSGVKPKDPVFIRKHATTRSAAEECIKEYEFNFLCHVLNNCPYDCHEDKQTTLERLLEADPLGLKPIPKSNTNCWKALRDYAPVEGDGTYMSDSGHSEEGSSSESEDPDTAKTLKQKPESAPTAVTPVVEMATVKGKGKQKKTDKKVSKNKSRKKRRKASKKKAREKAASKDGESKKGGSDNVAAKPVEGDASSASEGDATDGVSSLAAMATNATDETAYTAPEQVHVQRTAIMVKTPLYNTLEQLNLEYFKHVRASIFKFMDKEGQEYLTNLIDAEESRRQIPYERRADKDVRLPWEWVTSTILNKVCLQTLGDYYFRSLLKASRRAQETRSNWCKRVDTVHQSIMTYKHGWQKIGCRSAVWKLWSFLSEAEQEVVWIYYRDRVNTAVVRYITVDAMKWDESLGDLIKVITLKVPDDRWKTEDFHPDMCPAGQALVMYEHTDYMKIKNELVASRRVAQKREEIIKTLKKDGRKLLKRGSKREREREAAKAKRDRTNLKNPPAMEDEDHVDFNDQDDPVPSGNRNQKNKNKHTGLSKGDTACVSCLMKGLGFVHHKVCDKNKQKSKIEAMNRQKNKPISFHASLAFKSRNKRTYSLDEYGPSHCLMCMAFDINPRFALKHNANQCLFTYDGAVQKHLGVTFEKMASSYKREKLELARRVVWKQEAEKRTANREKRRNARVQMTNIRVQPGDPSNPSPAKKARKDRKNFKSEPRFHEVRYTATKMYQGKANDLEILTEVRDYLAKDPVALRAIRAELAKKADPEILETVKSTVWVKLPQNYVPIKRAAVPCGPREPEVMDVEDESEEDEYLPINLDEPKQEFVTDLRAGTLPLDGQQMLEHKLRTENRMLHDWTVFMRCPLAKAKGVDPEDESTVEALCLEATQTPCRDKGITTQHIRMVRQRLTINRTRHDLECIAFLNEGLSDEDWHMYNRTLIGGDLHDAIFEWNVDRERAETARVTLYNQLQERGRYANRMARMQAVRLQRERGDYVKRPKQLRRAKNGRTKSVVYHPDTGWSKDLYQDTPTLTPNSEPDDVEDAGTDSPATDAPKKVSANSHITNILRYERVVNDTTYPTDSGRERKALGLSKDGRKIRLRRKGQATVFELPLETYIPAIRPRVSLPIARTEFGPDNFKQSNVSKDTKSRFISETKGHRLLQCFMDYIDPKGNVRTGRVQLDTQSNINYCLSGIGVSREWKPWEVRHALGATNKMFSLGKPTAFKAMRNKVPIIVDTNDPPSGHLTGDCVALLGLEAIQMLGIDLNYHTSFYSHKRIKFLDDLTEAEELCDKTLRETLEEYAEPLTAKDMCRVVHLSERVVKQYLETHEGEYESKPIPLESLDINPALDKKHGDEILKLSRMYKDVFASNTNTLPPAMKHVKPHKFKLKPDAKPTRVPQPKFSPSKERLILEWLEWAEGAPDEVGLVEPAPGSAYAARLHLAAKYKAGTPKSAPPDGIRITWAGVEANETLQKSVATYTDAWEQLYKVANFKYKFSADGLKQYWTIPLDEESKDLTSFWTPKGLYRFTRLVMGTKNAATIAQNAYTDAIHTDLPNEFRPNIANFADDYLGGADAIEGPGGLLEVFEAFLQMCRKAGITLNPRKVRIGYESDTFFGLTVDKGKISPADRNLDPVRRMVNPSTRSELRSVMGVFNQFKVFVKDYGRSAPVLKLNSLNSTKVPFIWTDAHTEALDAVRKTVLKEVHLWAPRHDLPLHLETDGSDDGWGAVLFQIVDGKRRVIKMWSKKWDTEAWRKKPPYHREAKAWMNGMELALPYTMCNQFPLECYTDHSPLTWVKHTSGKGPVSQFIIDKMSLVDYNMHYIRGVDNVIADALSRFPMLGPRTLTRIGVKNSLSVLLSALIDTDLDVSKLWFDARKDTKHLLAEVTEWRDAVQKSAEGKRIRMEHMSESNIRKLAYTFGIWAPDADKVTRQCLEAFKKGEPFACLIPSDLVAFIAQEPDGTYNHEVAKLVKESGKISFLDTQLAWIIHKAPLVSRIYHIERAEPELVKKGPIRAVFNNDRVPVGTQSESFMNDPSKRVMEEPNLDQVKALMKSTNLTPPLLGCPDRREWIRLQKQHRIPQIWAFKSTRTADGLHCYQEGDDGPLRTIVPRALQVPLIKWKHVSMCHMGPAKVHHELSKRFYWKNMWSMCMHIVKSCALCASLKAKMRLAHKHFRAKLFSKPRTSYGADYYGVKKNNLGYCAILGIIDLASGDLVLKATTSPNAAHCTNTLFHDVVLRKGVPLRFHTDAAQAFLSKAVGALTEVLGIKHTHTLAHNPKSNAKIERVWEFVGRALKSMTTMQYQQFQLYLPILEHVWNNTPDSDSGHTPFEIEHGMPMRGVAESLTERPPDGGLPADVNDFKAIAASAYAFAESLQQIKAIEKVRAAERLNSRGFAKREFHLGDRVTFYLPPSQEQAQKLGKNPKHCLQYAGPALVTKSLSDNGTAWRLRWNGRTYNRNIMHMQPYAPDAHVLLEQRAVQDNTVQVGSYVAVLDDGDDLNYHLALVTDMTDQLTLLRYLGTESNEIRSAVWQWAYHRSNSTYVLKKDDEPNKQLVGSVETLAIGKSLIILPNVGLDEHMRLTRDSRNILKEFPEKHHVHGDTWDRQTRKRKRTNKNTR